MEHHHCLSNKQHGRLICRAGGNNYMSAIDKQWAQGVALGPILYITQHNILKYKSLKCGGGGGGKLIY